MSSSRRKGPQPGGAEFRGVDADTIAAIATPQGQGGVGIVRVSGLAARGIGERITGRRLEPRKVVRGLFRGRNGDNIDDGLALYFAAPASFTGEDVVELQGHGGPVVMGLLLDEVCALGARLARPGEFTERAYLNGKMDLAQAEAVADLIASSSVAGAKAAVRSLQGEFSARVHDIDDLLRELRTYVEAAIDFPDEEVEFLEHGQVGERLAVLHTRLESLAAASRQGLLLRDGVSVALVGPPNVGKSSLLNALAGEERAIVTEVPGTTRDLIRAEVDMDGLPVEIVDTAGLRESTDRVEREGILRAQRAAEDADLVLNLVDSTAPMARPGGDANSLTVFTKIDLTQDEPGVLADGSGVRVSALDGRGLDDLRARIRSAVGFTDHHGAFTARRRHLSALAEAETALARAADLAGEGAAAELIAEEFRLAHEALGTIVGATAPDELLGEIFASFCIGK